METPSKRFVTKPKGRKLTAEKYHLFADCRHATIGEDWESVEVTDDIQKLLALTACTFCWRRAYEKTASEVINDKVLHMTNNLLDDVGDEIVADLEEHGFVIKRVSRPTPPDRRE